MDEITDSQKDEVKNKVIDLFGVDVVKEIDTIYFALHDIRTQSKDSYEFIKMVKDKYGDNGVLVVGSILYGMKAGEETTTYYYETIKKRVPSYGHAT
jgi:hypothetical protein